MIFKTKTQPTVFEPHKRSVVDRIIEIKVATPTDARGIAELEVRNYGPYQKPFEDMVQLIQNSLEKSEKGTLLWKIWSVYAHDQIVAYGKCGYMDLEDKSTMVGRDQAWILNGVEVDLQWRRKSIARRLVQRRLEWLKERTDLVLYSTALDNDVSVALHREFGFIPYQHHMPSKGRNGIALNQWFYLSLD